MEAIVIRDFGEATVEEVPRPAPEADEALIEVNRVQLSITECQLYQGHELSRIDTVRERIRSGDGRLFGHEFCGEIVETGSDVTDFTEGTRVYAPGKITCGDCPYCSAGYTVYCENRQVLGMHRPGALAEYLTLPVEALGTIPTGVSDAEAAAMQPLYGALIYVQEAEIESGDVAVVLGTGVMGYQCGQIALQHGASDVIAIDVVDEKLKVARDRGMIPIDARKSDVVERVRDLTDGIGADVVFEAVGGDQDHATDGSSPLAQATKMVRPGGTLVQVGLVIGELTISPRVFKSKGVRWVHPASYDTHTGPNTTASDFVCKQVASGRVSIDDYITHEVSGLDSFDDAIDITIDKEKYDALGPAQIVISE